MIKDDFRPIESVDMPKQRGKFRITAKKKVDKVAKKIDFNFPKTIFGAVLIAAGIGCNYVNFLTFLADWLLNAGIGLVVVGVGLKINRKFNGGEAFKNEVQIIKLLFKKKGN